MPNATPRASKNSKSAKAASAASRTRGKPAAKKTRKPAAKSPRAPRKKTAAPKESPDALQARRDELLSSIAAAEQRLGDLRRQAEELDTVREQVAAARRERDAAREEAAEAAKAAATQAAVVAERAEPEDAEDVRGESAPGPADELPRVDTLAAQEQADDLRERLVRFLNDAWGIEKEQMDLLRTLAEESGDMNVRALLAEHRAATERQHAALEARMEALGVRPSGGRGLLGKLATRLWDAMQKPQDQADEAVLSLLKAASAAECEAGVYATVHAYARAAGDAGTAELAAAHYREERRRGDELRAALAAAVLRAARR